MTQLSIDIIRHWIPDIRQTKNLAVYICDCCPRCKERNVKSKKSFRVNTKLKVFKCYQCGMGGITTKSFLRQLPHNIKKNRRHRHTFINRRVLSNRFENPIHYVQSRYEYELPF